MKNKLQSIIFVLCILFGGVVIDGASRGSINGITIDDYKRDGKTVTFRFTTTGFEHGRFVVVKINGSIRTRFMFNTRNYVKLHDVRKNAKIELLVVGINNRVLGGVSTELYK